MFDSFCLNMMMDRELFKSIYSPEFQAVNLGVKLRKFVDFKLLIRRI